MKCGSGWDRSARGLDGQLQKLRDRLADMRELSLEEMMLIQSDPIDITAYVEDARKVVSGKERLEALVSLAGIVPLIDATKEIADERERMQGSVSHLFGSSTFSTDARKVATRAGLGVGEPSDEAVFTEVVRAFRWRIDLCVKALIYPALEVLMLEHRFDTGFLTDICYESPAVPRGTLACGRVGCGTGFPATSHRPFRCSYPRSSSWCAFT